MISVVYYFWFKTEETHTYIHNLFIFSHTFKQLNHTENLFLALEKLFFFSLFLTPSLHTPQHTKIQKKIYNTINSIFRIFCFYYDCVVV